MRYMGGGGCISYCYITQPDFFHRDLGYSEAGLFTNTARIRRNGLLTDADRNVC